MPQVAESAKAQKLNVPAAALPKAIPFEQLNQALGAIPADVATVTRVEPVTKPAMIIVHLQQMHGVMSGLDVSKIPPDVLSAARKLLPFGQAQQAKVLDTLTGSGGVKEAYAENLPPSTLKHFEDAITQLRGEPGQLLQVIIEKTKADTPEKLRQYLKDNKDSKDPLVHLLQVQAERTWIPLMEARREIASDFMLRAAYYQKVKLLPGEDEKLHKEATDYAQKNPTATMGEGGDPKMNELQDKREAALFSVVSKSGKPVSLVILGAGHNLRDEVAAHNKANPTKQIQLVEILPKATEEYLKAAEVK